MADVEIDTNVKDFTNRINFGIIVCTSGTRPTAVNGKAIYETDTDKFLIYNGATWEEISGGGGGDFYADGSVPMTGNLLINKSNPYIYLKPTDATSPAVLLKDSADNIKGRMYTTGDDMVIRPDDGHLYLSTTVTTGGNVLLETKGTTRLTVADAGLTSTVPLAMSTNKVTGLADGTTNGDALRYEQIADASFINLLKNGDFESWSAGTSSAPDKWGGHNSPTIAREVSIIKTGVYSMKVTPSGVSSRVRGYITPYTYYQGKIVTLGAWVYASAEGAVVHLRDGLTSSNSSEHSGGSDWEWLTVTKTLSGSASEFRYSCDPDITNGTGIAYFDGIILVEGSICPAFSPKPLVDDGKSIQIDSTTNSVTLGRDPTSDTEAATKKYVDDNSGGIGDFLANGTVPMTGNLQMGDNDITGADTIQATASQNLTLKVSTGSSIIFQAV